MFSGKEPLCLVIPTAVSERTSASVREQAGGTLRYNFLARILPLIESRESDTPDPCHFERLRGSLRLRTSRKIRECFALEMQLQGVLTRIVAASSAATLECLESPRLVWHSRPRLWRSIERPLMWLPGTRFFGAGDKERYSQTLSS